MSDQRKCPADLCESDDNQSPRRNSSKEYSGEMDKGEQQRDRGIHWLKFEISTVDRDHIARLNYLCALPE